MNNTKLTDIWEDYENGKAYQNSIGMTTQIPTNVDFYEGRQWAVGSEDTKDLPRPVVNIVRFTVRNKKSSLIGSPVAVSFRSDKNPDLAERLTEFNRVIGKEMDIDELHNRMVSDGIVKGSGFLHFYWDADAISNDSNYEGGVRGEVIDPLNIFFANPTETDEQKQKWILIASRVELDAVKAMCDNSVSAAEKEAIEADDKENAYSGEEEQNGGKLVTVITKYFRQDCEVYYVRATKNLILHKPIALTPPKITENDIETEKDEDKPTEEEIEKEPVESELPDEVEEKSEDEAPKMSLYPIQAYAYEAREKCIYGLSEVEGLIPNQKSINFQIAMQLMSFQNTAMGKYIVKPGALGRQRINNKPGQVLTDYYEQGIGIRKLEEPSYSSMPMSVVETLSNMTRTVSGSTEVMTGEVGSGAQSGAAIANLQSQAMKPLQEIRDRFIRSCKRGASILKQFYSVYYEDKEFEYVNDNGEVVDDIFNQEEFKNQTFDVICEASAGTPFSESMTVNLLSEFLQAGYIDFQTYLDLLPPQIVSFKSTLEKKIEQGQANKMQQMESTLQSYQKAIEQQNQVLQSQGKTMDNITSIIQKNRQLEQVLASLQSEYTAKINQANEIINQQGMAQKEATDDAKTLAYMMAQEDNQKTNGAKSEV